MLTKEQVDHLFDFCNKHYVQFYDVQVELVDHLANAIEAKMAVDKQLSFETALNSVYQGFGIRGFSDIVKTHTKTVTKRCRKIKRRIFFSYFTWPKATITMCALLIFWLLPKFLSGDVIFYVMLVIVLVLWVYETYLLRKVRALWKRNVKPLILIGVGADEPFFSIPVGIQIGFIFFRKSNLSNEDPRFIFWIYAVGIVVIVLLFITTLAYKEFAFKLDQLARREYPEAFAVAG